MLTLSRTACLAGLLIGPMASAAVAQNYSPDARRIALGGTGGTPNIASGVVEDQRPYTSIVIPIGLIRVLTNVRVFFPNRDDFDLAKAVELATRPMHLTFSRDDDTDGAFANDVARGSVNRDLNAYRGFKVAESMFAEGLVSPTWGKTFKVRQNERGFHGIYAGAGPYVAARADAQFDASLANLFGASTDRYFPSASFGVAGGEIDQLALAITGGYRARFPLPGAPTVGAGRDGIYVAADYHYLIGLRLDSIHAALRLETDLEGLIAGEPATPPLTVVWETSRSGRGQALDFGTTVVVNRWQFGAGVGGVANRIVWKKIDRHDLTLPSLFRGNNFIHLESRLPVTRRFELPVTYTGDVAYHHDVWSLLTEYSKGLQGHHFLTGFEYRFPSMDVRTGVRYSQGRWYPSGGIGFHLSRRIALDVAAFGTKTFLEQERRVALAVSLRLEPRRQTAEAGSPEKH